VYWKSPAVWDVTLQSLGDWCLTFLDDVVVSFLRVGMSKKIAVIWDDKQWHSE
jgi:hypothetical protein